MLSSLLGGILNVLSSFLYLAARWATNTDPRSFASSFVEQADMSTEHDSSKPSPITIRRLLECLISKVLEVATAKPCSLNDR